MRASPFAFVVLLPFQLMNSQFNRTAIFVSLGLSIVLVLGVILGAKYVFTTADRAPVAMPTLPGDAASSPECSALIASLPEKFMGHPRATIADPVPDGAAAWATLSDEAVTLRCGVDMPFQYNAYSTLTDIDGEPWLEVTDMTPQSDLTTWYTTNRTPAVAVTTPGDKKPEGLDLNVLTQKAQPTHPAPLADLAAASTADASVCPALLNSLPANFVSGYAPFSGDVPDNTYVWIGQGRESIVMHCGVAPPPGYKAGAQLTQVNSIPWFEDTTVASGTTASTWFALGRSTDIALYVPQDVAQDALVALGDVIAANTPSQ